ncbi:hypothetical protein FRC10_012039, partial [Ceratobasidium sp. 414]
MPEHAQCLEAQDQQNKKLNKLVEDLAGMIPSLEFVKRFAGANLGETLTAMLDLIEDDQVEVFIAKFERLRMEFDTRMAAQTLETVQRMEFDARMAAQTLETAQGENKVAQAEGYDSTRACMPNTRVAIIHDITTWVQERSGSRQLAWVHGLAGLGKSSIATSVCKQLDERGILGASFFCKRDGPELRDPQRVLTTVAYNLALRCKPYGDAVAALVSDNPEAYPEHVQPLCDALLVKPLREVTGSNQPGHILTVLVDALDECGTIDTRKQLITCLYNISQAAPWLRVVVTSRPDPDIQECFAQLSSDCYTPYNVLSYDSLPDINVFIRARLSNMGRIDGWPKDAVDRLSSRSSGLFIWARTACEFVTRGPNPRRRLDKVLAGAHLGNPSAQLDDLYTTAIK